MNPCSKKQPVILGEGHTWQAVSAHALTARLPKVTEALQVGNSCGRLHDVEFRPETLGIFVKVEGMEVMMVIFFILSIFREVVFFLFIVGKGLELMSSFEVFEYKFMCYPVFEEPRSVFLTSFSIFQSNLIGERMYIFSIFFKYKSSKTAKTQNRTSPPEK